MALLSFDKEELKGRLVLNSKNFKIRNTLTYTVWERGCSHIHLSSHCWNNLATYPLDQLQCSVVGQTDKNVTVFYDMQQKYHPPPHNLTDGQHLLQIFSLVHITLKCRVRCCGGIDRGASKSLYSGSLCFTLRKIEGDLK